MPLVDVLPVLWGDGNGGVYILVDAIGRVAIYIVIATFISTCAAVFAGCIPTKANLHQLQHRMIGVQV